MKVTARVSRHKNDGIYYKKGEVYEVNVSDTAFCCDDMESAWGQGFVGFGEADGFLNKNKNVNVFRCYPYPEGAVFEEIAIRFCPFCAEKIEVEVFDDAAALSEA